MQRADFENKIGRKLPPNTVYIDLDDPRNQVAAERVTHGQTDTQIKAQSLEDLEKQVASALRVIESLQGHLQTANTQLDIAKALRQRRIELGD